MIPLVISKVVDHDLCIGCGVCAALCPEGILQMQFNKYGEYNPISIGNCTKECGLCAKVCPFMDGNPNEDKLGRDLYGDIPGIQHRSETGYFLKGFVGHSKVDGHREHGSSGGMATWLLETQLVDGIVDAVVCVTPHSDPDRLFCFAVFSLVDEVRASSGSAYYPVELSVVLAYILEHPGKYAIIGLPCFVKAIRLAQARNRLLRERIVAVLGLTCGQMKSRHFTDYIAFLAGVQGKLMSVCYRGKSPDQPANNYYYTFSTENGEEKRIFWRDGISEAWTNQWFTPNACNYCDDVFAECADITFMDAWLPEYSKDSRGTNLVLVRSPDMRIVIEERQGIYLSPISIEKLVQSQAGIVVIKRRQLAYRLYLDGEKGLITLRKRVEPGRSKNMFLRQQVILKERMQRLSKECWITNKKEGKQVHKVMQPYLRQLQRGTIVLKVISLPIRIIRKAMSGKRDE